MVSLFMSVESALFLSRGNLFLTKEQIAEMSSTKLGANFDIVNNLTEQVTDSRFGFIILLFSIISQILVVFFYQDEVFSLDINVLAYSIFISFASYLILSFLSKRKSQHLSKDIKESIIKSQSIKR